MTAASEGFAAQVVRWQREHGRSHLPWQNTQDPYRVWLSEIMLQQTQVTTVLDYFARFLQRFPDVRALAAASQDDVLALWSGLGYYSRARNMHKCAQDVVERFGGEFPRTAEQLETLPGIGRSTAAAISSFCFGERVAILDGNVKRVLTRVLGFGSDLASSANEKMLWAEATALVPKTSKDMPAYTQGVMDLGATVCTPRKPTCLVCPVHARCVARAEGRQESYPVRTKKLKRTSEALWLLWAATDDGNVWLAKRPQTGVWAGLYCLPVFGSEDDLSAVLPARAAKAAEHMPAFTHVLTHKDLHLHPVRVALPRKAGPMPDGQWFTMEQALALGLPSPIRKPLTDRPARGDA